MEPDWPGTNDRLKWDTQAHGNIGGQVPAT